MSGKLPIRLLWCRRSGQLRTLHEELFERAGGLDYQTLEAHGRRVVRLHIKRGDAAEALQKVFADAISS